MRDVRKRPAVHKRGDAFAGLDDIGTQCVLEQHQHAADRLKVVCGHWLPGGVEGDHHAPQPPPQVVVILGQTQCRHDLGRRGDVEPALARHTIEVATQTN